MLRDVLAFLKSILLIASVVSMVCVSYAHKAGASEMSEDLQAYIAAGGSLSDICGLAGSFGDAELVDCEACRITDNLNATGGFSELLFIGEQKHFAFKFIAKQLAQSRGLDPARLTRAPPQT